jgi:hypothetical protein
MKSSLYLPLKDHALMTDFSALRRSADLWFAGPERPICSGPDSEPSLISLVNRILDSTFVLCGSTVVPY